LTPDTDKENPKEIKIGFSLLAVLLIAVTALFIFGWLAEEVFEGQTEKFDAFVRFSVHQFSTPTVTHLMQAFSVLGSIAVMTPVVFLAICGLIYFHRPRAAALLAIAMVGAGGLDIGLKYAFHRARPVSFFGTSPGSYSFPSGHALASLCFYGSLAAILTARVRGRTAKICIWIIAAFLVAMIGLSRIYLGVHYPSDVIAGYCVAAAWVGMVVFLDRALGKRRAKSSRVNS